jgi:hypothetical protein
VNKIERQQSWEFWKLRESKDCHAQGRRIELIASAVLEEAPSATAATVEDKIKRRGVPSRRSGQGHPFEAGPRLWLVQRPPSLA